MTAVEKQHKFFIRKGKNLYCFLNISLKQCLTRFDAEISHLGGRITKISRSGVTPRDFSIKIDNEGIPKGQGFLQATTIVQFPKSIVPKHLPKLISYLKEINESIGDNKSKTAKSDTYFIANMTIPGCPFY